MAPVPGGRLTMKQETLRLRDVYLRHAARFHAGILLVACFAVYSNGYNHAYNLDSVNGIKLNSYVRSLKFVPLYFTDQQTLTSNRGNRDYRPLLQTTYALNYAVSGYRIWSWHLVQVILHAACALGLYLFCRRVFPASTRYSEATIANGAFIAGRTETARKRACNVRRDTRITQYYVGESRLTMSV